MRIFILLLTITAAFAQLIITVPSASPSTPSLTSSLASPSASPSIAPDISFPACAQRCVANLVPEFYSDLEKACSVWEGSDSATENGVSASDLREKLDGCVSDLCRTSEEMEFKSRVAAACAKSTSASASATPTAKEAKATASATAEDKTTQSKAAGQNAQPDKGLSIGAIAGIVVGILALVFLLMLAAFLCLRRRSNRHHYRDAALEANRPSVWGSAPSHGIELSPPGSRDGDVVSPVSAALAGEKRLGGGEALAPPPWSPVSPITHGQLNRQASVVSAMSLDSSLDSRGDVTPPPQPSPTKRASIARADSVSWRREVEEAARRAARRVSAMASAPMLEAHEGERRSSSGSRPGSVGKRWSRK